MVRKSQLFRRSRRENSDEPRDRRYTVKVSAEEDAQLQARAAVAGGITVPRLMFEAAMNANVETKTDRLEVLRNIYALQNALASVGNNVNQLAKFANTEGHVPSDAAATLQEVRRVARLLEAASREWERP